MAKKPAHAPTLPNTPKYRRQKRKGRADTAFVEIDGRRIALGVYGAPESMARYHAVVAEAITNKGRPPVPPNEITVIEVCDLFVAHAQEHYRREDGSTTWEHANVKAAIAPMTELFGHLPVVEFGPRRLLAVRDAMIRKDWVRTNINRNIRRIKTIYKWAASKELVPASVWHGLQTVTGLRRGRSAAKESTPVGPVPEALIDAALPFMSSPVAAMVRLQTLTGMRPGEVTTMRACDLDLSGDVWLYRPPQHKLSYMGRERVVALGPQAQEIVRPFLTNRPIDANLFRPIDADRERREKQTAERKTPKSCGNTVGSNRKARPTKQPGEKYDNTSYNRSIANACDKADVPRWSAGRLRHTFASRMRNKVGIDELQAMLGHSSGSKVFEVYAMRDTARVVEIMARVG